MRSKQIKSIGASAAFAIALICPAAAQDPYVGQIMWTGASFCPAGWAAAQGQLLPISENETLFALIGTTYGGDGQTTFALPDLRGRVPVHVGTSFFGSVALGETIGQESATASVVQMPAHTHGATTGLTARAAGAAGDTSAPAGEVLAMSGVARVYAPAPANVDMDATSLSAQTVVQPAGGSAPISVLQPVLTLNACVSLFGVFPSQS